MSVRGVAGGVVASAAVLVVGWQIGAAQVTASSAASAPATGSSTSGSTGTGTGSSAGTGTGTGAGTSTGTGSGSSGSSSTATPSPSATTTPSTGSSGSSTSTSSISGTFQGSTSQTQFGPVQVEIVVSKGKITDVKALQLTNDGGRSVEISNQAAPILRSEALSAQSAHIQSVSGATYTSDGYISSLQAAIDTAGL
jgi:uncharacterized protein with FMN-binding domain